VGENGRVWIDGSPEGIRWARKAVHALASSGHRADIDELLTTLENELKGDA